MLVLDLEKTLSISLDETQPCSRLSLLRTMSVSSSLPHPDELWCNGIWITPVWPRPRGRWFLFVQSFFFVKVILWLWVSNVFQRFCHLNFKGGIIFSQAKLVIFNEISKVNKMLTNLNIAYIFPPSIGLTDLSKLFFDT